MDNRQWYKENNYGLMIHWGLYSLLAGEYRGQKVMDYAEWAQSYFRIPNAEYAQLARAFNPIYFNAEDWVRFAKDCGFKYIVITSKHHDGFAMYHSKHPFNVVDATPFGRDVIGELAEACAKHGLKLGLYYSQDLDWSHPDGGGYKTTFGCSGTTWDNSWDFPDRERKDFSRCFEEKMLPQIDEITTKYGDLFLIWFDVPMTLNASQSRLIYELVRRNQPDCLMNSRLGNGVYDYVSLNDNEIPDELPRDTGTAVDMNALGGFKPSPYGLYECLETLNHTWGFSQYDQDWKTPETIAATHKKLARLGINYLVNVGPDPLGRIQADAQRILRKAAECM